MIMITKIIKKQRLSNYKRNYRLRNKENIESYSLFDQYDKKNIFKKINYVLKDKISDQL